MENRTHDLPACSIVPRQTTLPRVRYMVSIDDNYIFSWKEML
jgi:hypothetical protein